MRNDVADNGEAWKHFEVLCLKFFTITAHLLDGCSTHLGKNTTRYRQVAGVLFHQHKMIGYLCIASERTLSNQVSRCTGM